MADRVTLFGVDIDKLSLSGAARQVVDWLDDTAEGAADTVGSGCKFVVTPNVDHVVMLQKNAPLRAAYQDAALVLADGFPLIVASKLFGKPLPERVAGSELIPELFDQLADRDRPTRVFLLGAMPGVAVKAARQIDKRWPHIHIVGTQSPPFGFERNEQECATILRNLEAAAADVVIFGVGAPKQEIWAHRFYQRIPAKALFCVGATIDFLAGEKSQAPVWMRRCGMEWLHRCASEPRRLIGRYAKDALIFPSILFREWAKSR